MKDLFIGISSSVGRYFVNDFYYNSVFTHYKNQINNSIRFNLLEDNIEDIVNLKEFKNVFILSAISDPNECFIKNKFTKKFNVESTKKLLMNIFKHSCKIFFFSTEFIYDGVKGNYNENDIANPILEYGKQKLNIENFITDNYDNFIIYRLAKTYTNKLNEKSLISNWYEHFILNKNQEVDIANDQIFSPIFANDLPKISKTLIKNDFKGKINIGGSEALSRLDCLKIFIEIFKIKNVNINKKSINNFNLPELRPINTSLDTKLLQNIIDFKLKKFSDICKECYEKFPKK